MESYKLNPMDYTEKLSQLGKDLALIQADIEPVVLKGGAQGRWDLSEVELKRQLR